MNEFIEKLIGRLEEKAVGHREAGFEMERKGLSNIADKQYAKHTTYLNAISIVNQLAEEYNNGWISVEDRLPEDCDNRFYMCIVENHEEDLPMFCQYDGNYGFGFWQDIYDEHTLGFVDSEFRTNEELGYEKVVAWQNVPSYQPKGE